MYTGKFIPTPKNERTLGRPLAISKDWARLSGLYSHPVNRTILVEFSLMKNINLTSNRVCYSIIIAANKYEL